MGKASRAKHERDAGTRLKAGLVFRVGMQHGSPLPIIMDFYLDDKLIFPSRWPVADARNIALGLLKYVELAEQRDREKLEQVKAYA